MAHVTGGRTRQLVPYVIVAPIVIYEALFILYPILQGIGLSFTKTELGVKTSTFVGLDNYERMFTSSSMAAVTRATIIYSIGVIIGSVLAGLVAALIIDRTRRGRIFIVAILMLPWALPDVPTVIIFNWMFNPEFGVMNVFARLLPGVTENPTWFLDPTLAMVGVLTTTIWKVFPFYALVLLAALSTVPRDLRDAAQIDGAGPYRYFRHITLPWIRPTILVLVLLAFIFSFRQFTLIHLLTGGGPGSATETLVIRIQNTAFRFFDLSYGATLGVAGLVVTCVVATLFIFVQRRYASEV